jgi:hypothetical protein
LQVKLLGDRRFIKTASGWAWNYEFRRNTNSAFIVEPRNAHQPLFSDFDWNHQTLETLCGEAEAHGSEYLDALHEIIAEAESRA